MNTALASVADADQHLTHKPQMRRVAYHDHTNIARVGQRVPDYYWPTSVL